MNSESKLVLILHSKREETKATNGMPSDKEEEPKLLRNKGKELHSRRTPMTPRNALAKEGT